MQRDGLTAIRASKPSMCGGLKIVKSGENVVK
jgi:hypothetical protein